MYFNPVKDNLKSFDIPAPTIVDQTCKVISLSFELCRMDEGMCGYPILV